MGWDGMGWDYPKCTTPNTVSTVHPVPLYHLGWDGIIPSVPPPTQSLLSIPSHCTIWDGTGLSQVYHPQHNSLYCPSCPIVPFGMGWDYPKCTTPNTVSTVHPVLLYHLGWDGIPSVPPPTQSPLSIPSVPPPTQSLLSIPSHCTIKDGMGWDDPKCTTPNTVSTVHPVPLYHLGWDGMG